MSTHDSVLVIANRTAESPDLMAALRRIDAGEGLDFRLVVPAVPHGAAWAADMKAGEEEAEDRAIAGAEAMTIAGLYVAGATVGDPDPFSAADDALRTGDYMCVVISTLPRSLSRWLHVSLPDRVRRVTDTPVVHVETRLWAADTPVPSGRRVGMAV